MNEHPSVGTLWQNYLATLGETPENTGKSYTSWHFCDNPQDANDLALLVLRGTKRATASTLTSYEEEGEELPREGDCSIVTDWEGRAVCIIRTTRLRIFPFNEVPPEFAAREGEGDGSLEYWRRVHRAFFSPGASKVRSGISGGYARALRGFRGGLPPGGMKNRGNESITPVEKSMSRSSIGSFFAQIFPGVIPERAAEKAPKPLQLLYCILRNRRLPMRELPPPPPPEPNRPGRLPRLSRD